MNDRPAMHASRGGRRSGPRGLPPAAQAVDNGVLKRDVGPFEGSVSDIVFHGAHTTGGDSGSALVRADTGEAIGIHSYNDCAGGGASYGSAVTNPGLQTSLAHPLGLCAPYRTLEFSYPSGRPSQLHPSGGTTLTVVVSSVAEPIIRHPIDDAFEAFYRIGATTHHLTSTRIGPNTYEVTFPAIACDTEVEYFFTAETATDMSLPTGGSAVDPPHLPPAEHVLYRVIAGEITWAFQDSFEQDLSWVVQDAAGLTGGSWERAVPSGQGDRGDPPSDTEPGTSGSCFVTEDGPGNTDVDGGWTRLTSPRLDASRADATLSYRRWFSNAFGDAPGEDVLAVEVSDDDGRSWVVLETVGPSGPEANGGWVFKDWPVADIPGIVPSKLLRVRFTASDAGSPSVVEAGIDRVTVRSVQCIGAGD